MSNTLDITQPLKEPGKFIAPNVKVVSIEKRPKVWKVKLEGSPITFSCFPSHVAKFAKALEEGAQADADIEVEKKEGYSPEAIIRSFGGPSPVAQRGGGGGGGRQSSYVPKSDDEIHAASMCGLGKSVVDLVVAGKISVPDIPGTYDVLADAYWRNLRKGKGNAAQATPQQAEVVELRLHAGGELNPQAVETVAAEYWKTIGGTDEQFSKFQTYCQVRGLNWQDQIVSAELHGQSLVQLVEFVKSQPLVGAGKVEPGDFRNHAGPSSQTLDPSRSAGSSKSEGPTRDCREEFMKIAREQGWPEGWAIDKAFYQSLFLRALKRHVKTQTDYNHLGNHDWWVVYQFALKVVAGEEEPLFAMRSTRKGAQSA